MVKSRRGFLAMLGLGAVAGPASLIVAAEVAPIPPIAVAWYSALDRGVFMHFPEPLLVKWSDLDTYEMWPVRPAS